MEEEATATEIAFGAKAALHPPISHFPLTFSNAFKGEIVRARNVGVAARSVRYRKGGKSAFEPSLFSSFFFIAQQPGSQKSRGDSAVMGGAMVWVTSRGCWKGGSTVGQVWQCTFPFLPLRLFIAILSVVRGRKIDSLAGGGRGGRRLLYLGGGGHKTELSG